MKKKGVLAFVLFGCVVVAIAIILLCRPQDVPFPQIAAPEQGVWQAGSEQEEHVPNWSDLMSAVQGESIINDVFRVTVTSSCISKSLNHLAKIDPKYYLGFEPPDVDDSNTFLDDHLYVEVAVDIENVKSESVTLSLGNFHLEGVVENNMPGMGPKDLSVTSLELDHSRKDAFLSMMGPGEKRSLFLGYIITDQEFEELKASLCLLPDITGSSYMFPESVYLIRLAPEVVL